MKYTSSFFLFIAIFTLCTAKAVALLSCEVTPYDNWKHCVKISNGSIELIATTDVGPRIIRFGFCDGENLFKEFPGMVGKTGGDEWRVYGGHRFWHAPEAQPRTYAPDNSPVQYIWKDNILKLVQPTEASTGIQKELTIIMDPDKNTVRIVHRLINHNLWEVTLAPWALTVMRSGGRAIFPQEPFRPHEEALLPARPMALWYYTDMADHRWIWGTHYIQLKQDTRAKKPQKIGMLNRQGWMAYLWDNDIFIKRFPFIDNATYPDFGCNCESYTNSDMLELESLGPLAPLSPKGGTVTHIEDWFLFHGRADTREHALDKVLKPLIKQTDEMIMEKNNR